MQFFFDYFIIFFIYSVLGWIAETIFVSAKFNQLLNRGFLIGPYCPIYGVGSVGMILYLEQYKDNFITVFILGVVICSILEYFTSYIMEVLFKTRWWDYSDKKFNLNGRVCGENSILFGIGGVFVLYIIHPILTYCLDKINNALLFGFSVGLFLIFLIDLILSLNIINRLKNTIINIEPKFGEDSTQEISKLVKKTIHEKHKFFQERLFAAFPDINLKKLINLKTDITQELKELLKK